MSNNNKTTQKRVSRICIVLVLILVIYTGIIYFLVSASLISSFMQKLTLFDWIVEKCYGQQVQSEDIAKHLKNGQGPFQNWLNTVEHQEFYVTTEDGYRLVCREFFPDDSRPESHVWVLLLHGYTGDKEAMYPYAYWYTNKQGYHSIAPDLRCQGDSEGDWIGMGWLDHFDCQLIIDYILKQDPQAQIILHGQSMGSSTALMMTGEANLSPQVKAVISDCAYTDAYSMFQQKAKDWFHLPPFPVIDSMNLMFQLRGGFDLKKADALAAVKQSRTPTLFIHGDQDAMISVDMSKELYAEAACDKELLIIEGAGHAQAQAKDPTLYYNTIAAFIRKNLQDK